MKGLYLLSIIKSNLGDLFSSCSINFVWKSLLWVRFEVRLKGQIWWYTYRMVSVELWLIFGQYMITKVQLLYVSWKPRVWQSVVKNKMFTFFLKPLTFNANQFLFKYIHDFNFSLFWTFYQFGQLPRWDAQSDKKLNTFVILFWFSSLKVFNNTIKVLKGKKLLRKS